jgi:hypothetical protein
MGFTRIGYLCRHIYCVFRVHKIKEIPLRYVTNRWRRQVLPSRVYSIANRLSADNSEFSALRNQVMDCVSVCVDRLSGRVDGLSCFADKIKELKKEILEDNPAPSSSKRRAVMIEGLIGKVNPADGCSGDADPALRPPQGIRNKGCGTNRRLIGPGEKAVETSKKQPRLCRSCMQWCYHDTYCKNKQKDDGSTN